MSGVITFRHVVAHPLLTAQVVGWRTLPSIIVDALRHRQRTLLSYVRVSA